MIYSDKVGENGESPEKDNTVLSQDQKDLILSYWDSDLSQDRIGIKAKCRHSKVKQLYLETYGEAALKMRQKYVLSRSKVGNNNPMKAKTYSEHHNWTVVKPEWYYAPEKKRVFEHHVNYASYYGLSNIPDNFEIHHLDFNSSNNEPSNLVMLTRYDHAKLHKWLSSIGYEKCNDYLERE